MLLRKNKKYTVYNFEVFILYNIIEDQYAIFNQTFLYVKSCYN